MRCSTLAVWWILDFKNMHASRRDLLKWADELASALEVAFKEWYGVIGLPSSAPRAGA
jgi:hypothetical protein